MDARLKLKREIIEAQKVKELLQFSLPSVDYSQGYQPTPTLRLRPKVMGGSSIDRDRDTYISQSITELLSRTIVE